MEASSPSKRIGCVNGTLASQDRLAVNAEAQRKVRAIWRLDGAATAIARAT